MQVEINPLEHLPFAAGKLLDQCAKALGLPAREIDDPTGHVVLCETDAAYRERLGAVLREVADRCGRSSKGPITLEGRHVGSEPPKFPARR